MRILRSSNVSLPVVANNSLFGPSCEHTPNNKGANYSIPGGSWHNNKSRGCSWTGREVYYRGRQAHLNFIYDTIGYVVAACILPKNIAFNLAALSGYRSYFQHTIVIVYKDYDATTNVVSDNWAVLGSWAGSSDFAGFQWVAGDVITPIYNGLNFTGFDASGRRFACYGGIQQTNQTPELFRMLLFEFAPDYSSLSSTTIINDAVVTHAHYTQNNDTISGAIVAGMPAVLHAKMENDHLVLLQEDLTALSHTNSFKNTDANIAWNAEFNYINSNGIPSSFMVSAQPSHIARLSRLCINRWRRKAVVRRCGC